ncbi:hypothetical protein ACHAXM_002374 [Skeletonema potamos]
MKYQNGPTTMASVYCTSSMIDQFRRPRASSLCAPTRPGELIEEWPASPAHLRCQKGVRFSESSALYVYEKTTTPVNELFYTSSERSVLSKRDTVQEAVRIRRLVRDGMEASGEDVPTLAQCGVEGSEIVGIEHLVLFKVPRKISKIRKHHSQMVLLEQEKQRAEFQDDPSRLAAEAAVLSEKSSIQARNRAVAAFHFK